MKKAGILVVMAVVAGFAPYVKAAETFTPNPSADMWDLDHYRYYTWGLDLGFNTVDTPITEASLMFKNIRNWAPEDNILYIHLLDGQGIKPGGLDAGRDVTPNGDYFAGQGILIATWSDKKWVSQGQDLVFNFTAEQLAVLNAYGADGYIGFGFDPDCHYYNDGISFTVATAVVPAPGAVMLAGIGTMLVGWLRRRRSL